MSQRALSTASTPVASVGIAFDIDGVFVRGRSVLPFAAATLRRVRDLRIPHIFLTNGGGMMEREKAAQLARWFDAPVSPEQVVLSHSPMRALAAELAHRNVLVSGNDRVPAVAREYGFQRVCSVAEMVAAHPVLWPHRKTTPLHEEMRVELPAVLKGAAPSHTAHAASGASTSGAAAAPSTPFHIEETDAVLVLHDGLDWGAELQVICDALLAGVRRTGQQTPLFFSNPDIVYAGAYAHPRLAQGAFRVALEAVYESVSGGRRMQYTQCGKPTRTTYAFAEELLLRQARALGYAGMHLRCVYGIGDNPAADIRGANKKEGWRSVLVETGVFRPTAEHPNDPVDPADFVVRDVAAAIDLIEREGVYLPPL